MKLTIKEKIVGNGRVREEVIFRADTIIDIRNIIKLSHNFISNRLKSNITFIEGRTKVTFTMEIE